VVLQLILTEDLGIGCFYFKRPILHNYMDSTPLPGTGVWTGSIVAALMDIRFKLACPAIFVGNVIAAIIVMVVSYGVAGVVG